MQNKPGIGIAVNIHNSTHNPKQPTAQTDTPFCIAILGNFSGKKNKTSKRRLIEIDRDNYETVMDDFNIHLKLTLSENQSIDINFKELDDFHPDTLYENLESFNQLKNLKRRLNNNQTFADAAAEIQSWLPDSITKNSQPEPTSANTNEAAPEGLLDSILNIQKDATPDATSQIDSLIKSIVAPYAQPKADPRQDEMLSVVDTALTAHMRDILHHADFQAMESAWQSVYFLIRRVDTNSRLKIFLLDISKEELQTELAVEDISTSGLYHLFCDTAEGDLPLSALMGNYQFTDTLNDINTLANISIIAQQAGAPFLSAASETLVGCQSFSATPDYSDWNYSINDETSDAWNQLRKSPAASYLGLALPRFLLRLPYGKKTDPIDSFKFEEMPDENINHSHYLWGNAAFIKIECMARNFTQNNWNMRLAEVSQTDSMPLHYYTEEGESAVKPIAEILLTEKGGEIIRANGMIPIWSVKNQDCIRSSDYCSISETDEEICGRWA